MYLRFPVLCNIVKPRGSTSERWRMTSSHATCLTQFAIFIFTSTFFLRKKHALAPAIKILQGTTFILSMFFFRKTHHKKMMHKYALSFWCFCEGSPHIHPRKLTSSRKGAMFKENFQPLYNFHGICWFWGSNKKHVFPGKTRAIILPTQTMRYYKGHPAR